MAKYAAYFRVSTENQGKSGLGLQAQQEAVQRFLKEDDSIDAEFTEVESGKRHQNRPQLAAALDYCRQRGCVFLSEAPPGTCGIWEKGGWVPVLILDRH